jgi:hypothetical protein
MREVRHWSFCGFIQDAPLQSNVTEPAGWGSAAPGGGRRARAPLHLLVCNSAERLLPPGRVGGEAFIAPSTPLTPRWRQNGYSVAHAASGAAQRARTAGWGISRPSWGSHRTLVPLLPLLRHWAKRLVRKDAVGSGAGPLSARQGANGRQERIGARAPARAPISLLLLAQAGAGTKVSAAMESRSEDGLRTGWHRSRMPHAERPGGSRLKGDLVWRRRASGVRAPRSSDWRAALSKGSLQGRMVRGRRRWSFGVRRQADSL